MKYFSRIGNNEYEVEITDGQVLLNGKPVDVNMVRSGVPELYSVLFGGRSYEMLVSSERYNYTVTLRSEQFQVQVEDERTRRLNQARRLPSLPEGELAVTAPIPGLVVKVLVDTGDAIEDGQPLVILEAMKMENEIRSVRQGIVKSLAVVPGQRVEQNAVLVILE
ncbi:MAG: acetyl-CoA carboxylase biotin carboxyl carrier protein subunit [Caldilineaceae bacterium]|nr:acetyl-CoA carboxylase biotin carboxyl carrier protein subunit [Caldilineaceae bacterium]